LPKHPAGGEARARAMIFFSYMRLQILKTKKKKKLKRKDKKSFLKKTEESTFRSPFSSSSIFFHGLLFLMAAYRAMEGRRLCAG
jgi:hypothetical protein